MITVRIYPIIQGSLDKNIIYGMNALLYSAMANDFDSVHKWLILAKADELGELVC